jgi:hypothetical protein
MVVVVVTCFFLLVMKYSQGNQVMAMAAGG